MNINELMINDLVYIDNHIYKLHKLIDLYNISTNTNIKPIPLTSKILESNGFICEEGIENAFGIGNEYSLDTPDSYVEIFWRDSCESMTSAGTDDFIEELWYILVAKNGWSIEKNGNVIYVHELQHILRLCGLNDIADSFIVNIKNN